MLREGAGVRMNEGEGSLIGSSSSVERGSAEVWEKGRGRMVSESVYERSVCGEFEQTFWRGRRVLGWKRGKAQSNELELISAVASSPQTATPSFFLQRWQPRFHSFRIHREELVGS